MHCWFVVYSMYFPFAGKDKGCFCIFNMRIINEACCSSWHGMYRNIQKLKVPVYLIAVDFVAGVYKKIGHLIFHN